MTEEPRDTQEPTPEAAAQPAAQPAAEPASEPAAQPVPAGKADLAKRFIAVVIDAVIAMVVGFIPIVGGLIAAAYWLVRDGLDIEFMDHRSLGKKVMKLRPVTLDGEPLDIAGSAKRNWMFALGGIAQMFAFTIIGLVIAIPLAFVAFLLGILELILVIVDPEGRRMGDKIAGSKVIEVDE
jgi:uncharacterized RDD family membrane protein YckC